MKLSTLLKELSISLELATDPEIDGISTLRDATGAKISYAVSDKHLDALQNTGAAAVLVTEKLREMVCTTAIAVVVGDPELSMAHASRLFRENFDLPRVGS